MIRFMKRSMRRSMILLAVLLAVLMTLSALPGLGEENGERLTQPDYDVTGDWYAEISGVTMKLVFSENGSYRQTVPGREEESAEGTWEELSGMIILDGDENVPLLRTENGLRVGATGLRFTREAPKGYEPEDVMQGTETDLTEFQGAWSSAYVMLDEEAVPAEYLGDDTILYIEGRRAALTGDLFGEMIVDMAYEDGAMTLADETQGIRITLQMQADYRMRMRVRAGENELVYILNAYQPEQMPL